MASADQGRAGYSGSRRSILFAGASGIAASAAAFAGHVAIAATVEAAPDPIFALIQKVREGKAAQDEANVQLDRAWARHQELGGLPEVPEALFRDPKRDWIAGFAGFVGKKYGDGRWWYGSPDDIAYLRRPRLKQDWTRAVVDDEGIIPAYVPDPVGQARADEILAAFDEYEAEIERRVRQSGLSDAMAAVAEADQLFDAARTAVATTRATTPAGLYAKARYAFETFEEDVYLTEAIAEEEPHEALSLSILRDLIKLGGRA